MSSDTMSLEKLRMDHAELLATMKSQYLPERNEEVMVIWRDLHGESDSPTFSAGALAASLRLFEHAFQEWRQLQIHLSHFEDDLQASGFAGITRRDQGRVRALRHGTTCIDDPGELRQCLEEVRALQNKHSVSLADPEQAQGLVREMKSAIAERSSWINKARACGLEIRDGIPGLSPYHQEVLIATRRVGDIWSDDGLPALVRASTHALRDLVLERDKGPFG